MTKAPTTAHQVADAATAIEQEGAVPSIRRVIARLGGGSPNHIGPLLGAWKMTRQSVASTPVELDQSVVDSIARQIRNVASQATAAVEAQLREMEDNAALLAQSSGSMEAQLREKQAELDGASRQLQQQHGRLEALVAELETLRSDSAEAIAESRSEAMSERAAAEDLRRQLVRATMLLESLPRLEKLLQDRDQSLQAANVDLAKAREVAAVAAENATAQQQRADEAGERESALRKELASLRVELAEAWQCERALRLEVQALVSQAASSDARFSELSRQFASAQSHRKPIGSRHSKRS
ncbi:DNA-binding protein [Roseateles oligotrophus]|uniref:DNA-binding protein n=1 Tax=Roseateles oligotrophus TaxID=1769250 RepID=A0ABT2Y8E9_9BURK|nr:DNA-binding protein [Roseateles oligotrophus]MCV2366576.1 DNA-binding protein [Roseateles oligotrophus]